MNIHHYDQQTGEYLGQGVADADPLNVGGWLIPAHATTIEPPAHVEGSTRHFIAGGWEYQEIPTPEPEPTPATPDPLELCKAEAKERLEATDWAMLPDVNISNRAAFEAYRDSVRALYITPVAAPVWPERPEAAWL